jgi:hypothetical protein
MAGAPPTVGGSRERLVRWKHLVTAHMMVPAARPGAPRAALPAPAVQRIRAVSRKSVFQPGFSAAAGAPPRVLGRYAHRNPTLAGNPSSPRR